MQMVFDISEDEIPIFLAEVDEHLQALDEILVQIENLDSESELLQTALTGCANTPLRSAPR